MAKAKGCPLKCLPNHNWKQLKSDCATLGCIPNTAADLWNIVLITDGWLKILVTNMSGKETQLKCKDMQHVDWWMKDEFEVFAFAACSKITRTRTTLPQLRTAKCGDETLNYFSVFSSPILFRCKSRFLSIFGVVFACWTQKPMVKWIGCQFMSNVFVECKRICSEITVLVFGCDKIFPQKFPDFFALVWMGFNKTWIGQWTNKSIASLHLRPIVCPSCYRQDFLPCRVCLVIFLFLREDDQFVLKTARTVKEQESQRTARDHRC